MRPLRRRDLMRLAGASGASYLLGHALGGCAEPMPEPLPVDPMGRWWLSGNYAPVPDEIEAFDLEIEGALPPELDGTFLRNGSNPHAGESAHWFLGDGMLHGVRLQAGRALWYRNRYIHTLALAGGGSLAANWGNTALREHAGRVLALYEAGVPYHVDPETLATHGEYDFAGVLRRPMSAHPKIDPVTGEMFFIGYAPFAPFLTYHVVDRLGALTRSVELPMDHCAMMHDFQVTERWAVLFDLPLHFDASLLGAGGFPFRWVPEAASRFGLVARDGSSTEIRWFEVEQGFLFHSFNAFETAEGRVVVEGCRLPSIWSGDMADASATPVPWRWELDPAGGTSSEGRLFEGAVDFPQLDARRVGRRQQIHYGLYFHEHSELAVAQPLGVVKSLRDGALTRWTPEAGHQPDEALFVPFGEAEDDGYLLSMVFDAGRARSYVAVLDATAIERGPLAKVWMPRRVPFGFHGTWVAGS